MNTHQYDNGIRHLHTHRTPRICTSNRRMPRVCMCKAGRPAPTRERAHAVRSMLCSWFSIYPFLSYSRSARSSLHGGTAFSAAWRCSSDDDDTAQSCWHPRQIRIQKSPCDDNRQSSRNWAYWQALMDAVSKIKSRLRSIITERLYFQATTCSSHLTQPRCGPPGPRHGVCRARLLPPHAAQARRG